MKIDIKKIGPYLHSNVLPINVEFLTLSHYKGNFVYSLKYRLEKCHSKCLGRENSDFLMILKKIPNWLS